jgi:hypothetical protein
MVKKLHKKSSGLLNPGETILGACAIMPVGQFKKTVAFGAVGGLVGAAVGQAIAGKPSPVAADSMAHEFPALRQAILAVSDQRWVVFQQSAMSGAAKSVAAQWPLEAITGVEITEGKLTSKIDVCFADGSVAHAEAVRAAKPASLVDAAASVRR